MTETRVFARIPEAKLPEGPSLDRTGNIVDIPHGRVFRVTPDGRPTRIAESRGDPNDLEIHRDEG